VILYFHSNIGQYGVLMNSISGMLPKCQVECSISGHNNTSSISVWANGSLDLYPTSRRSGMRTCCILYLTLNQYYHNNLLYLVNWRAGWGTHLSKGSSMALRMVVEITPTIPRLYEMCKSYSLYVYVWMCVLCHMVYVCGTMWMICCIFFRQCGWYGVCLRQSGW
jgi:hypothetical protein